MDHRHPIRLVNGIELHRKGLGRTCLSADDYTIEDRGHESPCWIWRFNLDRDGYANVVSISGVRERPHRVAFREHYGFDAAPHVDHLCNQRACIRGDHLRQATPAENVRRSRSTHLTVEDVAAIRADSRTQAAIAAEYGLTQSAVSRIRSGKRWAD